jgi:lysine decarboxylase
VIVDQAWGAHLGFAPGYPPHALALGADAMVLSAHKTLPAYSQAAVVAARTERLDRGRLERGFDAANTTSPAGTILASVDAARAVLDSPAGRDRLATLATLVADARATLRESPALAGAALPGPEHFAPGRYDPAKLVVLLAGSSRSGVDIERQLITAGLPVEQANRDTVIPIVTLADDAESVAALCTQLSEAATAAPHVRRSPEAGWAWRTELPPVAVDPRTAFFAERERVDAERAVGRVCGEVVAPYPPGVPVLVPGEFITADALDALRAAAASGVRIAYASDPTLRTWEVLRRNITTR